MEQQLITEGIKLYKNGKYTDALKFFQSLSANEVDDSDTAYYIGLCYMQLEKYEDALLYLEQVVTIIPEDKRGQDRILQCRMTLAVIYAKTDRIRLAEFELKSLEESGYKPATVYAAMAYIAWTQQEYENCVNYYEKALDIEPENVTALNGLGYVLACLNKDLTRALMLSKRALDMSAQSIACLDTVGWVYYKLGLYEEAQSFLKKALSIDSSNEEVVEHLKVVQANGSAPKLGGQ